MKDLVIAVDARPLCRPMSGIRRYLECLLPHLFSQSQSNVQWILYLDGEPLSTISIPGDNARVRKPNLSHGRFLVWNLIVPFWLKNDQPHIYWSPRHHLPLVVPKAIKVVVTVHDLVWATHPDTVPYLNLLSEKLFFPLALKRADRLITVSQATKDELLRLFPSVSSKTQVIRNGTMLKESVFGDRWQALQKTEDIEPCFLAVGAIEPRKNYQRLIHGYELYCDQGGSYLLKIVGQRGWKVDIHKLISDCRYSERVSVEINVDDQRLAELYSLSTAFVCVSLAEGYCLPVIEASSFNKKMVLSDIPVFREFEFKTSPVFVDPKSEASIGTGLLKIEKVSDPSQKTQPGKRHSWGFAAQKIALGFREIANFKRKTAA